MRLCANLIYVPTQLPLKCQEYPYSYIYTAIDTTTKNFKIPCYKWLFKELLLKNEQDQNPFHIAAKSGKTDNNIYTSFLFFRESGDGGISPSERC